jgi:hypothetical protein
MKRQYWTGSIHFRKDLSYSNPGAWLQVNQLLIIDAIANKGIDQCKAGKFDDSHVKASTAVLVGV